MYNLGAREVVCHEMGELSQHATTQQRPSRKPSMTGGVLATAAMMRYRPIHTH